jgi:hypothetical protein
MEAVLGLNDALYEHLTVLADSTGLPFDQVRLVFALLISYPMAYLFSFLSNATLRVSALFSLEI